VKAIKDGAKKTDHFANSATLLHDTPCSFSHNQLVFRHINNLEPCFLVLVLLPTIGVEPQSNFHIAVVFQVRTISSCITVSPFTAYSNSKQWSTNRGITV